MTLLHKKNQDLVVTVLRFAGGSIFLWFGIDKWLNPELWFGSMPEWFWPFLPISADVFIVFLGIFESVVGLLFVAGRCVRGASVAAILYLAAVFSLNGISQIAVRDNALMGIYLALFVHENRMAKRMFSRHWTFVLVSIFVLSLFFSGLAFLQH